MPDSCGNMTDIVPLIEPSHVQKLQFSASGYPKNASFHFVGYNGPDDKDRIVDDICRSAFLTGSRMRGEKRKQKTSVRSLTVDIICVKSRFLKSTKHEFIGDQVQANNTILQTEHSKYRKKGRPSSLSNQYANCTETNSPKRKTTSIRPHDKESCCGFRFTIFCSKLNDKWYLSYGSR